MMSISAQNLESGGVFACLCPDHVYIPHQSRSRTAAVPIPRNVKPNIKVTLTLLAQNALHPVTKPSE